MLRALVLLLVLANAGFYAWSQGWLDDLSGIRAQGDREPERLARQVRPEAVRIVLPGASAAAPSVAAAVANSAPASAAAAANAAAPACLEAGPFDDAALAAAEAALKAAAPALAPASWSDVADEKGGVWIVYMGKFANHEALLKKAEELKRYRALPFEELSGVPEHQPGLSLGRHDDRASADKALEQLTQRGIRTAHVLELTPPTPVHRLRVAKADARLVKQLVALKSAALGQGFVPCATLPAN